MRRAAFGSSVQPNTISAAGQAEAAVADLVPGVRVGRRFGGQDFKLDRHQHVANRADGDQVGADGQHRVAVRAPQGGGVGDVGFVADVELEIVREDLEAADAHGLQPASAVATTALASS
jgi:hypothetical protein